MRATPIILLTLVLSVAIAGMESHMVLAANTNAEEPAIDQSDELALTASPGHKQITLTWNVPADTNTLDGYTIEGKHGSDDEFVQVQTLAVDVRSATIDCALSLTCQLSSTVTGTGNTITATLESLVNGQEYNFRVHVNDTMSGYYSNTVTAEPVDTPRQPQNLGATPGFNSVTLQWSPPDNEESPLTHYVIVGRIGSVNPFTVIATIPASTTTYTVMELESEIPYDFAVYAQNVAGIGEASNLVTVIPLEPTDSRI